MSEIPAPIIADAAKALGPVLGLSEWKLEAAARAALTAGIPIILAALEAERVAHEETRRELEAWKDEAYGENGPR